MNQWAFVIAAYAVTLGGMAALLVRALVACRRAEARSDAIGERK